MKKNHLPLCRVVHKNIHLYFSTLFNNFWILIFLKSQKVNNWKKSTVHNVDLPILTAYCSNARFWVAGVFPTFMKAGSDVIMQKSARDVKSTKFESLAIQTMQWQKEKWWTEIYKINTQITKDCVTGTPINTGVNWYALEGLSVPPPLLNIFSHSVLWFLATCAILFYFVFKI